MLLSKAFEGFKLYRLAGGISPATIRGYDYALNKLIRFLDDPPLETITHTELLRFFANLRAQNLASRSYQSIWQSIRVFFKWAGEELSIPRPDTAITRPPAQGRLIQPFTDTEIRALLLACERTRQADSTRRKSFTMTRPTRAAVSKQTGRCDEQRRLFAFTCAYRQPGAGG